MTGRALPRRPARAAAVIAVAVLAGACGSAPAPTAQPTPTAAVLPSPSPSPSPSPQLLPPVQDVTGLTGEQMTAADPVALPGALADGTARLEAGGRTYLLAPARRVTPGTPPGLLLVLPAANTNLRTEYDRYGYDAFRDHGLAVAVVGTYGASWNAGRCCGKPNREGTDDVAVVTAVRKAAAQVAGADVARTAVVGHSVGALMAWRLVCTPGFDAAAAVPVSGTLVADCPPSLQLGADVLALHGADDASVPVDGSDRVVPLLGIAPPSVREVAAQVATAAGCTGPQREQVTTRWTGCTGGGSVALTVLPGRGHAWEGLEATRRTAGFLAEVLPGVG